MSRINMEECQIRCIYFLFGKDLLSNNKFIFKLVGFFDYFIKIYKISIQS